VAAVLLLPALGGIVAVLLLLGLTDRWLPDRAGAPATLVLCLLGTLLAILALLTGARSAEVLPLGLGFLRGSVALDPLAAVFLLPPFIAGAAAAAACLGQRASPCLPLLVAAAALTVLAADASMAVLAMGSLMAVCWAASPGDGRGLAAASGVFLLAAAFAVLSMGGQQSFAAMRAAPPEGMRAVAVLILTVAAACPLAGLLPIPTAIAGPVMVAVPKVTLYLVLRILLDLCGPATPGWWGGPLLALGAAAGVAGAVRACRAPTFSAALSGMAMQHTGWIVIGLGAALAARSADLLPVATLALGGATLHTLTHTLFGSLAAVSVGAAEAGAGSQTLDRLGGLARSMPVAALGLLIAGCSLANLPLSAGFGSAWMVLQAVFALPRIGGVPLQLLVVGVVLGFAASAGLGTAAMLRLGGAAFLGRPRTPRAAAAEDAALPARIAIACLAAACLALGCFPGVALRLVSAAQAMVTGAGLDGQDGWLGVQTQVEAPGYVPLVVLLVGGGMLLVVAVLMRAGRLPGRQPVPMWEGGFAAPPAWLPFGDPATQATAAAMATSLLGPLPSVPALPRPRLLWDKPAWPGLAPRHGLAVLLGLIAATVLTFALLSPA
jgi:formate hydrogenlyase subunit 3/multisubunit Na+/H+ antiporter MnhD subunit